MSYYYLISFGTLAVDIVLFLSLAVRIIAWCKIFKKAGLHPAKLFIPFYGTYLMYSIAESSSLFFVSIVVSFLCGLFSIFLKEYYSSAEVIISIISLTINLIISIIFNVRLSRNFGRSTAFAVGLILLNPIFLCILAFGPDEYLGYWEYL